LDPYFYIDPAWASTHPGYSLEVETGVGNAAPVPEPSSTVLIVAGLLALWGVGSIGQRFNYAAT
jgi:hypothetical protein